MPTSNAGAELALRLRAEALIAGFADLGAEEGMAALADVEAVADALAGAGMLDVEVAVGVVVDTVDALVVRGAAWVEARAVDLDVRRLYDLAAGAPRPRLRRVVAAFASTDDGRITSFDVWDDRTDAHLVGDGGEVAGVLGLDAGATFAVPPGEGRVASDGGTTAAVDGAEYLARLEAHAASAAHRQPGVDVLNSLRRRVVAAADALGDGSTSAAGRFDAAVAAIDATTATSLELLDVVPIAMRTPFGWLLAVERWSDHWRARVVDERVRGLWTAVDAGGTRYGGEPIGRGVVRFDPALETSPVTLQRAGLDGTSVDVEVVW